MNEETQNQIDTLNGQIDLLYEAIKRVANRLDRHLSDLEQYQLNSIKNDIYSLESRISRVEGEVQSLQHRVYYG